MMVSRRGCFCAAYFRAMMMTFVLWMPSAVMFLVLWLVGVVSFWPLLGLLGAVLFLLAGSLVATWLVPEKEREEVIDLIHRKDR